MPSRDTYPEWYSRHDSDDNLWKERCHDIVQRMVHSMTQIYRWGVGNASVMADFIGIPPSPGLSDQLYVDIMALVGSHTATLRSLRRTPVHLRTKGIPDHLLMKQARS